MGLLLLRLRQRDGEDAVLHIGLGVVELRVGEAEGALELAVDAFAAVNLVLVFALFGLALAGDDEDVVVIDADVDFFLLTEKEENKYMLK